MFLSRNWVDSAINEISTERLRGDARACALADQRTAAGNAIVGAAEIEAKSFAADAPAEATGGGKSIAIGIR